MSIDANITANFSDADRLTENFWARIEVEPPESDYISLSEAATVIDAIYGVNPCTDDSALVGGSPAQEIEAEEIESTLSSAFGLISYNPCKYDPGGYSYEAIIYIFRSHINIPYKLVINDGTILSTQVVQKAIKTLVLPEDKKIEVDYPIIGNIVCDEEIVSFVGAQALLKNNYTKNLSFEYTTQFDKVTIRVNGTEEAQDAECLVFYNELAYRATVSKPEEDSSAINSLGCNTSSTNGEETDPEPEGPAEAETCYQRYIYSTICQCSGNIKDSISVVSEVPCPASPATPHSDTEQGALNFWWQNKKINTYVHCPEDEAWEGQQVDYYLDNCCVLPPPGIWPPSCQHRTAAWLGGAGIINGADFHLDNAFHDEQVILVPVGPEDGICGTIEWIQDVQSKQCCDEPTLTDIVYDSENSADIIADYSGGMVYWTGGKAPFTVSVRGSGFFLNYGKSETDGQTDAHYAQIWTEDACGTCTITITDGCSEAEGVVQSTEGNWVNLDTGFVAYESPCEVRGLKATETLYPSVNCGVNYIVAWVGKTRWRQWVGAGGAWSGSSPPPCTPKYWYELDGCPWEDCYQVVCGSWVNFGCLTFDLSLISCGSHEREDDCSFTNFNYQQGPPDYKCLYTTGTKTYSTGIEKEEWRC